MLAITSNRLSNNRKPKRQVTYQPDRKQDADRSMFDILKEHKERENKKKQDLDRRFEDKLRNTAEGWQYSYREG